MALQLVFFDETPAVSAFQPEIALLSENAVCLYEIVTAWAISVRIYRHG
jgi:hypothetical protein